MTAYDRARAAAAALPAEPGRGYVLVEVEAALADALAKASGDTLRREVEPLLPQLRRVARLLRL